MMSPQKTRHHADGAEAAFQQLTTPLVQIVLPIITLTFAAATGLLYRLPLSIGAVVALGAATIGFAVSQLALQAQGAVLVLRDRRWLVPAADVATCVISVVTLFLIALR
ncbi:hypothetical protein [Gordonia sp. N1V]|uniref:hypothetical protein n=1 Tax=Gordonia sp. N1V TaxID=3034163 RepID=UPI0023E12288|nr:hypothetical protein [Gordonia sp. N1V]MDF3285486.1 hypothetical protein [Gordonia sp. N1V]